MDVVAGALDSQAWPSVAGLLDRIELESPLPDVLGPAWPHALHLLAHAYNADLPDARFAYMRMPAAVKQDNVELAAAFRLLQHLWQRDYQAMWRCLADGPWGAQAAPMARALHARLQAGTLALLQRAYGTIALPKAAALLGLPEGDVLQLVQQQGWQYDAAAGMLTVAQQQEPPGADGAQPGDLQRLAELVIHFQT